MRFPPASALVRQLVSRLALALGTWALLAGATPAGAEFRMGNDAIAACAGTHTDSGGPAGNYGNGEILQQTIWPGQPDSRVALSFTSFVTETGYDYLIIHDGHDGSAPVLAELNGTVPAQTITSTAADGSLTLTFLSDGSGTLPGWTAGISCVPAEQRMRNGIDYPCDGVFTDSGGPTGNYQGFESYVLTFYPTHAGDFLEVNFSEFDTESFDHLYAYNGSNTSAPLLGDFSGTTLPPVLRATNGSGSLTFRFISDGSIEAPGWRARFNCAHPVSTSAVTTCSGTAVDSGGAGGNYGNSESFVQTFFPEDLDAKMELFFYEFATDTGYDTLAIYDGNSTAAPLIGTYTGVVPPFDITSTAGDGALTLAWSSDTIVVDAGWAAFVDCVYPITASVVTTCSALTTDTGGRSGTYDNNESLLQEFHKARPWAEMRIDVPEFSSEAGYDFLRLRDGGAGAPVLISLTGDLAPPSFAIMARNPAGRMSLDWTSDFSNVAPGWVGLISCELPIFADGFEGRDLAQWSIAAP